MMEAALLVTPSFGTRSFEVAKFAKKREPLSHCLCEYAWTPHTAVASPGPVILSHTLLGIRNGPIGGPV